MWDIIQTNKRRSVILILLMGSVLIFLGSAIGYYFFPQDPVYGVFWGILIATLFWIILLVISFTGGERILLATAGAREIKKQDSPQLFNIVEEMRLASGLPAMPRVFVIDTATPNAFAVGLKPEKSAVAVTTGLMSKLNRDELQGVVAHEIGHISNRDTLYMTLAGVTMGSIIIIADLFLRGLWFSNITGGKRRSSSQGGGQFALIMMLVSILLAVLAPILAQLLYFATSRKREYLADASAAQFTRYPEGLASALEKISVHQNKKFSKSRTLVPMYIVNPLAASGKVAGLFSTHPPTEERIRILRNMVDGSSIMAYEKAFRKQYHNQGIFSPQTLHHSQEKGIRQPGEAAAAHNQKKSLRDIKNALHHQAGYALLACACGVKLKIPPGFTHQRVKCPRCKRVHTVPSEILASAAILADKYGAENRR
jgi:heat shock protein HtpX